MFGPRSFASACSLPKNRLVRSQDGTGPGTSPHQPPPTSPQGGATHCLSPPQECSLLGDAGFPSPTADFHPVPTRGGGTRPLPRPETRRPHPWPLDTGSLVIWAVPREHSASQNGQDCWVQGKRVGMPHWHLEAPGICWTNGGNGPGALGVRASQTWNRGAVEP